MKPFEIFQYVMGLTLMWFVQGVGAQLVPGEDPVTLNQKIIRDMLPLNPVIAPAQQNNNQEMPAWLDAKVTRLIAKAYSIDTTGIQTDENLVNTIATNGLQKVCIQDLASNTNPATTMRYGPQTAPQTVVLKGDLVNICR